MSEGDSEREGLRTREAQRFKITDRRHFTASGERRLDVADEEEPASPSRGGRMSGEVPAETATGFDRRSLDEPEGVDFTMLVNAIAQPALLFLGEIPHPATGQPAVDLEQARIQIDMLGLLGVKCRGNLTAQEEKLLDRILYQLRMLYVARTSRTG